MPAPHGGELIGLVRPRGRVGQVLWANDQLDANAQRGGSLGKIDALVVVRDAAADDVYLRRFELAEERILIGHFGAHGIDHVHAYDHVLRWGSRGLEKEDRDEQNCNSPGPLYALHPLLPHDCETSRFEQSPCSSFRYSLKHHRIVGVSVLNCKKVRRNDGREPSRHLTGHALVTMILKTLESLARYRATD